MKIMLAIPALALVAACATTPDQPIVHNGPPAPGGPVPIDQPVQVGQIVATPKAVIEDSRCPENARCIHAGRLVVSTRIDGAGWRETVPLILGEPHATHGTWISLVSGLPEKQAERQTRPEDYLFAFEGGD